MEGAVKQKNRADAEHLGIMRTESWLDRLFPDFPDEVRDTGSLCPEEVDSLFPLPLVFRLRLPSFLEMTLTTDDEDVAVTIFLVAE